jgi:hypothetical protein
MLPIRIDQRVAPRRHDSNIAQTDTAQLVPSQAAHFSTSAARSGRADRGEADELLQLRDEAGTMRPTIVQRAQRRHGSAFHETPNATENRQDMRGSGSIFLAEAHRKREHGEWCNQPPRVPISRSSNGPHGNTVKPPKQE